MPGHRTHQLQIDKCFVATATEERVKMVAREVFAAQELKIHREGENFLSHWPKGTFGRMANALAVSESDSYFRVEFFSVSFPGFTGVRLKLRLHVWFEPAGSLLLYLTMKKRMQQMYDEECNKCEKQLQTFIQNFFTVSQRFDVRLISKEDFDEAVKRIEGS